MDLVFFSTKPLLITTRYEDSKIPNLYLDGFSSDAASTGNPQLRVVTVSVAGSGATIGD